MDNKNYLKLTFGFRKYKSKLHIEKLENTLKGLYGIDSEDQRFFLTENGRSAFMIFLQSLNLEEGDEILLPSYTCPVIPAVILTLKLKPVYVDIDKESLTISPTDIERKISERTKVVVVQHSYGSNADMDKILEILKGRGIYVVEDCAQCLGFKRDGKMLGLQGDASIFSFGIDKVLSTRAGGFLLVNNENLISPVSRKYESIPYSSNLYTFKWMLNPLIWRVLRLFGVSISIRLAKILKNLKLLDMGIGADEVEGRTPKRFPTKLTNPLAAVADFYIREIEENVADRKEIVTAYIDAINEFEQNGVELPFENLFREKQPYHKFIIVMDKVEQVELLLNSLSDEGYYVIPSYDVPARGEAVFKTMEFDPNENPGIADYANRIIQLPTSKLMDTVSAKMLVKRIVEICNENVISE